MQIKILFWIQLNQLDIKSLKLEPRFTKKHYNSIICTAGGWLGGSIRDIEGLKGFKKMHAYCTVSALFTAHLASHYLSPKGLLMFTGAKSVYLGPTPGMIGYHIAKTATHAIAQNMATLEDLPKDAVVVTILPETLDTPSNREAMPDVDHSKWARCDHVASIIKMWSDGENVPKKWVVCYSWSK